MNGTPTAFGIMADVGGSFVRCAVLDWGSAPIECFQDDEVQGQSMPIEQNRPSQTLRSCLGMLYNVKAGEIPRASSMEAKEPEISPAWERGVCKW